ncbi:DUF262 domain-containing protein [Mycoplasmopsis pulmonis]|nr:DUF262 domain-containing protein [Mycoplasmopsis pulmonis]MDZ7293154.1 DUF262 domain-containing HNH endonuclease family protein [Mycoplasmopsis pulmonis]VEU67951.1 Protein of uncharacterised function DUF262 [Mycoplasmopsis pulmonis]
MTKDNYTTSEKFWKIGTSISSYIDNTTLINLKLLNKHSVLKEDFDNKENKYQILISDNSKINIIEKKKEATFYQIKRTLFFLGIFSFKDHEKAIFELDNHLSEFKKSHDFNFNFDSNDPNLFYKQIFEFLKEQYKTMNDKKFQIKSRTSFYFSLAYSYIFIKKYKTNKEILFKDGINDKAINYYKDIVENLKNIDDKDGEFENEIEKFLSIQDVDFEKTTKLIELKKSKTKTLDEYNENTKILKNNLKKIKTLALDYKNKNIQKVTNDKIEVQIFSVFDFIARLPYDQFKQIKIPIFQRKFSWDWSIITNLLSDINNKKEHKSFIFLGSIITVEEDKILKIIDGQQRISTLFLIFVALSIFSVKNKVEKWNFENLIDGFDSQNDDLAKKIFMCLEVLYESVNDQKGEKTVLSNYFYRIDGYDDVEIFSKIWSLNKLEKEMLEKENNIIKIFVDIIIWFRENLTSKDEILNFWKSFLENIYFTFTNLKDINEFDLFERMNTTQVPLSAIDLIKNRIFDFYEEKDEKIDQKSFQELFDKKIMKKFLSKKGDNNQDLKKIKEFLRYISSIYDISDNEVKLKSSDSTDMKLYFKFWIYIKDEIIYDKDEEKTLPYDQALKRLGDEIKLFFEVLEPSEYSKNKDQRFYFISDYLYTLISYKKTLYIPLIIQILKTQLGENKIFEFDSKIENENELNSLRDLLKAIQSYEIRRSVVAKEGQSMTSFMDSFLRDIKTINILDKHTLYNVFVNKTKNTNNLNHGTIKDFWENVAKKKIQSKNQDLLLIIFENFIKIEKDKKKNILTKEFFNFDLGSYLEKKNKLTIEHILPRSQGSNDQELDEFKDYIGNLLFIKRSDNSELGAKRFKEKKQLYNTKEYISVLKNVKGIEKESIDKYISEIKDMVEKYNENSIKDKEWNIEESEIKESLESLYILGEDKNDFGIEDIKKRSEGIAWILCLALQDL